MTSYPLIVAHYDLQGHPRRTERWSLVALQDANNVFEFELTGSWNNYQYIAGHKTRFGRTQTLRGGCKVGTIPAAKIDWLKTRLRDIEVVYNDINFDSQDWVLAALRMLRADGLPISLTSETNIREELAAERVRWDVGEDTIEDRLFN